ncbi:MAG: HAMP domain-containing sensor histidine kinase [Nitrososphaeraceae archaeon]
MAANLRGKETTEVLYGNDDIIRKTLETFSWIQNTLEGCVDHTEIAMHVTAFQIWDGLDQLKKRGVKIRMVTEITDSNICHAKKMMEIAEVRHLKGVRSSFGIADGIQYLDHAISENDQLSHAIISNVKAVVEAKQYLFETLWNMATPAEQTAREIEEGIEPTKTEIIQDTKVSINLSLNIIKSAKDEVLLIWATSKTFILAVRMGVAKIYADAAHKGVKIKLLIPYGDGIEDVIREIKTSVPQLQIRIADINLQTRITIMIVDRSEVMSWELRDDRIENPFEAGGMATYSNNKSIASSYATIFETLWKQTEMYEQSQRYNKMQREFINVAAHELRTPIQPILGLSNVLLSKKGDIEQYKDLLDAVNKSAKRLQKLTENILDLTKIESQSLQLKKQRINLNEIILNVVAEYDNQIKNVKNLGISFIPKDDILVEVDRLRISQVFDNILSNAIKFTKEGGNVTITIQRDNKENNKDDDVVVSIQDTGAGIDAGILPKLFTKFVSKSEKGIGLGLYISKSIIEAHGGKIWAKNNSDGKGATFYFSIATTKTNQKHVNESGIYQS